MKALLFAYNEIGVEALKTLLDLGVHVVGVVTHQDKPDETHWFQSVETLARERGIPVIAPEKANAPEVLAWGRERQPDIIFSFYFRKLLKKPWLELAPRGAYNLHGSLLPKFRGRACVNWAVVEGAAETGVTLHEMVEAADAGAILDQERVPIGESDTAADVFAKLVPAARRLLTRVVPLIAEGHAMRHPQNESEATTFGGRRPEDGRIDWKASARRVHNLVRAVARPFPGAFTYLDGKKLYIWKGHLGFAVATGSPGQVLEPVPEGVPVVTGDGIFIVEEVQWEGGPSVSARQILVQRAQILS